MKRFLNYVCNQKKFTSFWTFVISIEVNGILSNHCDTENNHDPTTTIQLDYKNIEMNDFQLLWSALYEPDATDDCIDISDNTLIYNEVTKNSETSTTTSTN